MNFKNFDEKYDKQEKELIVLRHEGGGGSKSNDYWVASAYFLAYVDAETGVLSPLEGRLVWPVTEKESAAGGCFDRFKDETIYRVKARTYNAAQPGMLPSFCNQFYVTEILEEDVKCPVLEEMLEEYRKPVVLQDDRLGEVVLNKSLSMFEGRVGWLDEDVSVLLDIVKDNKDSWTKAIKAMGNMLEKQGEWDEKMRSFAAETLTSLANDWQAEEDENLPEITEQDFAGRIRLHEISMDYDGSFSAYYDDDDMFWGHTVVVYGTLEQGVTSAQMEG